MIELGLLQPGSPLVAVFQDHPDWLPSEKAKSYKVWFDAVKKKRETHLGESKPESQFLTELMLHLRREGAYPETDPEDEAIFNKEVAAKYFRMGGKMFHIYIKLNDLLPPLLDMVDDKRITVKAGYRLSILTSEQQERLLKLLEIYKGVKINEGMAKKLRNCSETEWEHILDEVSKKKEEKVIIHIPMSGIHADEEEMRKCMADPALQARITEIVTETVTSFILEQEQKSHGKGR